MSVRYGFDCVGLSNQWHKAWPWRSVNLQGRRSAESVGCMSAGRRLHLSSRQVNSIGSGGACGSAWTLGSSRAGLHCQVFLPRRSVAMPRMSESKTLVPDDGSLDIGRPLRCTSAGSDVAPALVSCWHVHSDGLSEVSSSAAMNGHERPGSDQVAALALEVLLEMTKAKKVPRGPRGQNNNM